MLKKLLIMNCFIFVCLLTFSTVWADQAAYLSKEQSENAANLLKGKKQLLEYCSTCSVKKPKIIQIESITTGLAGYKDFWKIYINNEMIDLAYSYYKDNKLWRNIAISLDIEVLEVPEYLTEEQVSELGAEKAKYVDNRKNIELEFNECLKGLSGDSPMANCTYKALENWDKELNRVYQELMNNHLNEKGKKALRLAQQQWIKHRDSEIELIKTMYSRREFSGSMHIPMQAMDELLVTKERVLTLYRYLSLHNFE